MLDMARRTSWESAIDMSAQANVIVAREVAKRYADKRIISTACNPGVYNLWM